MFVDDKIEGHVNESSWNLDGVLVSLGCWDKIP